MVKNHISNNIKGAIPGGPVVNDNITAYSDLEISGIIENVWITDIDANTELIILAGNIFNGYTVNALINGIEYGDNLTFSDGDSEFQTVVLAIPIDRAQGLTIQLESDDTLGTAVTLFEAHIPRDDLVKSHINNVVNGSVDGFVGFNDSVTAYPELEIDGVIENVWITDFNANTKLIILAGNIFDGTGVNVLINGTVHNSLSFNGKESFQTVSSIILTDTKTFTIQLIDSNSGKKSGTITSSYPIINPIPNYTVEDGNTISFTVTASNTDAVLSFEIIEYEDRAVLSGAVIDANTGEFTWTPTVSQIGTHYITFKVTDSGSPVKTDLQDVTFTITKTPTFRFITSFGTSGSGDGQFDTPHGIAITDNRIYIADRLNDRIQIFDDNYNHLRSFGTSGSDDGQFDLVTGVTTSDSFVYVVDKNNDRVQAFLNDKYGFSFGGLGSNNGQFDGPYGIATDSKDIFVTDTNNHRVQILTSSGVFISSFGSEGTGEGQFNKPRGLVTHGDRIYVTDEGNNRVQVFDKSGNFVRSFGNEGTGDGEFNAPFGIAVSNDIILVTDRDNHRVQIFDSNYNFVDSFGSEGTENGQFTKPHGISIHDGTIYVMDTGNNRVQVFSYNIP